VTYVTESKIFSEYYSNMKLRIHGNSIRLRLNQADVTALAASGRVAAYLEFADSGHFTYALAASDAVSAAEARFENGGLTVYVPRARAEEWISSDAVAVTDDSSRRALGPAIIVEKDFACLQKRAGEDDAGTFPNPAYNRLF